MNLNLNPPTRRTILCVFLPLLMLSGAAQLHAQNRVPVIPPAPPAVTDPSTPAVGIAVPMATPTATPEPANRVQSMRLPLRRLIPLDAPIMMRNASSTYTVFVPQSARFESRTYNLRLKFTNSIALLGERSVLRVVMNDIIVAQFYLDRTKPFNEVDIDVPLSVVQVGFNRLQFIVAQHYTYKCEDPSAPELYTEIDPDRSYLSTTGEWKPVPERLSFLRWWVDEKFWVPYQFNICIPSSGAMSDLHLAWGAIVTQGMALAVNNQPFRVSTATALRPGMDNVVIGTMNELTPFLTATEAGSINGSFLAIKSLPGDPTRCMIIVSGRNEQEVSQTALALGLVNFGLPDSKYAIVDQMTLPEAAYVRNAPVQVPGIYSFRQLGFRTTTIKGWNTSTYTLRVYMPGDISRDDMSNAELRLHFVYGAGLRKDSVLNVFINGQFQTAVRLKDIEGATHWDHRLYLPMQAFQPGLNEIELAPKMVPLLSNQCEILQDENLQFTLYEDSEFVFPKALRKARLPSLGVFSQTAFPYSYPPDGTETAVHVTATNADTVCAAWTLMGKMAQISGALLHRTEISFRLPKSKKNLLVVGPRDTIPADLFAKAPVSPLETGRMRYVISTSPKPEKYAASPVEEFLQKFRNLPSERGEPEPPSTANMNMTADLIDDIVVTQFESPFHTGYPVTVATAWDAANLLAGMNTLQEREFWDRLAGDLAVWNTNPKSLEVAQVGGFFIYKATNIVTRVSNRFDQQPWFFAFIVVVVLLLLGIGARAFLRKREHPEPK
ncbi:MAG: cellulose biosynthesis cyclic di-GMP-binding regulatory protein BcsB [Terrimicrobiaceae bacterium]|nr:cellulose biosynthesis cyclic di-GMP-binding regulatory protein BcsB [Terrimicrobiaceae bacterium]